MGQAPFPDTASGYSTREGGFGPAEAGRRVHVADRREVGPWRRSARPPVHPSGCWGRHRRRPQRIPVPVTQAIVDCAIYTGGHRLPAPSPPLRPSPGLPNWRNPGSRPSCGSVCTTGPDFRCSPSPICSGCIHWPSRTRCTHQRPKAERYDDTVFMVLKTVNYVPHESVALAREIVETGDHGVRRPGFRRDGPARRPH